MRDLLSFEEVHLGVHVGQVELAWNLMFRLMLQLPILPQVDSLAMFILCLFAIYFTGLQQPEFGSLICNIPIGLDRGNPGFLENTVDSLGFVIYRNSVKLVKKIHPQGTRFFFGEVTCTAARILAANSVLSLGKCHLNQKMVCGNNRLFFLENIFWKCKLNLESYCLR